MTKRPELLSEKHGNYKPWDYLTEVGDYYFRISTGELPEMFSSVALSNILNAFYNKEMKVLDVGCGSGHYLKSFRKHINPDINYLGIDVTERHIELARKAYGNDALFKVGDIYDLPIENNEYDIVTCNNAILHLPPNPIKPFRELIRVSKKYVIIRTVFGERNYIIQEVRTEPENNGNLFYEDGTPKFVNYFNMYTEDYFRTIIKNINPDAKIDIIVDNSFKEFDNRNVTNNSTATKVINGIQVAGNLLLDWRFIIIKL